MVSPSSWGVSSVGRAPQWHCGGQRFETATLQDLNLIENSEYKELIVEIPLKLFSFEEIEEGLKLFGTGRVAHFAERFSFNLTDAFACHFKAKSDFFECFGFTV